MIAFISMLCIAWLVVSASGGAAVAALDPVTQAVVVRDALACQSPWQAIEGRDCRKLAVGTEVDVVSGDEFFACVVWPGAQRCMWVARDVLRKR